MPAALVSMVAIEDIYQRWENASESQKYMALLPLLEYGFEEGSEALIKNTPLTNYHLERLIEYALSWGTSGHWSELAIEWIESGLPINNSIYRLLISKEKRDSGFTQKQRHRIMKIANAWEIANET